MRPFGREKCFFLNGGRFGELEQRLHALARGERVREIIRYIYLRPGIDQRLHSRLLERRESTVKWHVDRLVAAGLVRAERRGRSNGLHLTAETGTVLSRMLQLPA